MQPTSLIPMMGFMIDFHLQLKSIVVRYVLEIIYNSVFAVNQLLVRNIGIIIINKTIDFIVPLYSEDVLFCILNIR
jgi:hypothetical protein